MASKEAEANAPLLARTESLDAPEEPVYLRGVLSIFFFPALGGLLYGYDIGATSMVLVMLEKDHTAGVSWWRAVKHSALLQGVITSTSTWGAAVGSLTCLRVEAVLGRRRELLVAGALYLAGSALEALSGVRGWAEAPGVTVLLVGRVLYGIAIGFAMHGAPAYIAEMAPPSYRGLLVSLKEGFIVLGMLLGYTAGLAFNERTQGWRCVYAIAVPIAACMIAGVFLLPPSARWLCLRGRLEDARASLGFVLPPKPAARAFDEISKAAGAAKSARGGKDEAFDIATVRARLSEPACAQALFIGIGLVVLQQFTGQPSVLYYVSSLFEQVGLGDSAAVGLAGFKLVCTLVAVFTVDKRGRKALLLVGCALMAVALAFLTIAFTLPNDFANRNSAAVLGAMFLYIGGYQVGFGPIVWTLISEIFPLDVRGQALAIAVVSNFVANGILSLCAASMLDWSDAGTFGIFLALDIYAIYFIWRYVPETKGLTLEEITALLTATSNGAHSSRE